MSDTYNQDPEQDQTPPTLQSALAAPQPGGIQDDGAQPAAPQTGGMPDMGPAPEIAQDTLGQGASKFASAAGDAMGRGWQNLKDSYPGQAAQAVGRGITDAVAGTANPAAPAGSEPAQSGGKRIASMLLGDSAAPPETLDQMKQTVDPRNSQPPGNQNLMAVDAAMQKGGPKAAWPIVQANRVAFNAKQAFAYTAASGINGKPADINAAVNAANEAEQHVLDGSNVKFSHGQSGQITATVTSATGGAPQTIPLTADQFKAYLDVGKDGQWDKLMDKTVPNTLLQIAKQNTATMDPSAKGAAPQPQQPQSQPQAAPRARQPVARDVTQADQADTTGQFDANGHYTGPQDEDKTGFDEEQIARSKKLFPLSNQEPDRQAWLNAQASQGEERQNKIDVAGETGKARIKVAQETGHSREAAATTTAGARVEASQNSAGARMYQADKNGEAQKAKALATLDAIAKKEQGIQGRSDARNQASLLRQKLANEAITPLTPEEQTQVKKIIGGTQAPQAPSGRPAAPQTQVAAPKPNVDHQQAIAWAKANPSDPRSAKILQMNGM